MSILPLLLKQPGDESLVGNTNQQPVNSRDKPSYVTKTDNGNMKVLAGANFVKLIIFFTDLL